MQELIRNITEKVGISEDQAKSTVEMVVDFLKDKLPQPIASQIHSVLQPGGGMGQTGEAARRFGGTMGKEG